MYAVRAPLFLAQPLERLQKASQLLANWGCSGPGGASFQRCAAVHADEGIREGRSVSPDFDVAVKRHQLLDVIQKASDTGIRQNL